MMTLERTQVEVTFALDANGILAVTAQDTVTGAKAGAEIKAKDGRLSADEIDKMVQDAEKHRAQDDELADKVRTSRRPSAPGHSLPATHAVC